MPLYSVAFQGFGKSAKDATGFLLGVAESSAEAEKMVRELLRDGGIVVEVREERKLDFNCGSVL